MEQKEQARNRLAETLVTYLVLMSYSSFVILIGVILTRLLDEFALDLDRGGLFTAVLYCGSVAGILASGALIDRHSKRGMIRISYALFTALVVGISVSGSLAMYLTLLFVAGVVSKFLEALLNARIAVLHGENKGFYLNLLHCCYGVGALSCPIVAGLLLEDEYSWRAIYFILAMASLLLLAVYCFVVRGRSRGFVPSVRYERPASFREMLEPRMLCLTLMIFLCSGYETGNNNWLPTYFSAALGTDMVTAGSGLSAFWLGLIVSRFLCSFIVRRIGERALLFAGCVAGAAVFAAAVLAGTEGPLFAGSAGAGLFAGATVPMILTLAYTWYPTAQGKATMVLFISASLGAMVIPWFMGVIGSRVNLDTAMLANIACLLATGLLTLCLPKERAARRG